MTIVERLIEIVSALDELRIPHLVMGGHAVRYYGFNRETTDYDLHIPAEAGQNLRELLSACLQTKKSGKVWTCQHREKYLMTCGRRSKL